jgi:hypothetical protein
MSQHKLLEDFDAKDVSRKLLLLEEVLGRVC